MFIPQCLLNESKSTKDIGGGISRVYVNTGKCEYVRHEGGDVIFTVNGTFDFRVTDSLAEKGKSAIRMELERNINKADDLFLEVLSGNYFGKKDIRFIRVKSIRIKGFAKMITDDRWNSGYEAEIVFDMSAWWTERIANGMSFSKSLFFRDWTIRFDGTMPEALAGIVPKRKRKKIEEETLKYAIGHSDKLISFLKRNTKLELTARTDIWVDVDDVACKIKLIPLSGLSKWLSHFGIPPKWAKWIATGITVFGIILLIKAIEGENVYRKIKDKIDRFLDK